MDKNTIIGFALILVILLGYSYYSRPSQDEIQRRQAYQDSVALAAVQQQIAREAELAMQQDLQVDPDTIRPDLGAFSPVALGESHEVVLESDELLLTFSTRGGGLVSAQLKNFTTFDKQPLVLFDQTDASIDFTFVTVDNRVVPTSSLYFTPVVRNDSTLEMSVELGEGKRMAFVYQVHSASFMVDCTVLCEGMDEVLSSRAYGLDVLWRQNLRQQERSNKFEGRYSGVYYKYIGDDVEHLKEDGSDDEKLSGKVKWIDFKDQFFSTAVIAGKGTSLTNCTVSHENAQRIGYLKDCEARFVMDFDPSQKEAASFCYYLGPNKFKYLKSLDEGREGDERLTLEEVVPLGWTLFAWVSKYFVIPVFNFLEKYITNYGVIILILTLIVKLVLLPLTYKSYMSTARMRVLRPQIDEINKKYPADKAMERQQATMALYSKAGVNPMGGCLPMLLQMPILMAMFFFLPTAFELRGQSFLWASDLSSYDSVFSWSQHIPFISRFYGNHVSLFCLLMAITNIIYTKINMASQPTNDQMPSMKWMMYLMPVMFLFFFNEYASGLSYYYFISSLFTILQTYIFRWCIDDEKLLAKINSKAAKPRKKSSFMQRLEEAQKRQLAMQREASKNARR